MTSIYIETTIPSLATSLASRDAIIAGRQAAAVVFWENERHKYDLYVSQYVIEECASGNTDAASRRLEFLKGIPVIQTSEEITNLAEIYQKVLGIPDRAKIDCLHLSTCVLAKIDCLLSWNCAHLGIKTFVKLREYNEKNNMHTPLLLTPEALIDEPMETEQ